MSNDQRAITITNNYQEDLDQNDESPIIRDIHALTPPRASRGPHREAWETSSRRSSSLSTGSSENFTSMSREFSALVLAGSTIGTGHETSSSNLGRIGEDDDHLHEENNPLAIVRDNNPLDPMQSPRGGNIGGSGGGGGGGELVLSSTVNGNRDNGGEVSVHRVKKEEVDSKINAWQNAKVAKINNRFKREDAIINGWEGEQVQKASSWMKKVERKLEEKRAKALEKMQNDIAKAHRKAEERRASSEAKRGTKVARVLEIANLMRTVGRAPVKRSFF